MKSLIKSISIKTSLQTTEFNVLFFNFLNNFMSELVNEFNEYREKMNEVILSKNNLVMKRLWNLDTNTYEEGAWIKKQKKCWDWLPVWFCVAMIVLNIIWENRMNLVLLPNRCMKFLPLPILLAEQL